MDFEISWFSQFSLNSKQSKKQRKHFRSSTNAHDFSIEILKELHWKRTCGKARISIIIAKTNEIATFWPPRINVKTTCFFVFYENNIASKYLWKIIKKHDISENLLKPSKQQHFGISGLTQGSPHTSKNTPRPPQDHPRTPPEIHLRFWCHLRPPQGPPRTPNSCSGRCPFAS